MAQVRTIARAFAGGEVTPEFWGRIDDGKYQTGLALCRNFIPLPHGPVQNRAGTAYVHTTKDSTKLSVVRPFSYSTDQTMVLEFGHHYLRFHTNGATLLRGVCPAYNGATVYSAGDLVSSGGVDYVFTNNNPTAGILPPNAAYWYAQPVTGELELPTFYDQADLASLRYVQSLDVMTITHPNYEPKELRRGGAVKWYFSFVEFKSVISAPVGVGVAATIPSGGATKNCSYVVTSVASNGDESTRSFIVSVLNNLNGISNLNTITWLAVSGAVRYNVYKKAGGIYGFIGEAEALTFIDDNITADISNCPPEYIVLFGGTGDYPTAVCYHEQRRCFAGTINQPQNFWATRSGTESNMQMAIPAREDDALAFKIAARENQSIRHILSMDDLIVLTASAEWLVTSNNGFISPSDFIAKPHTYVGCNDSQPLTPGSTVLFGAHRGGHMQELSFKNSQTKKLATEDISLTAPHLFDGYQLSDLAYSKSPYPIVWAISSSGLLLSLTYIKTEAGRDDIQAWARHDTAAAGVFESCCVVAEGAEDVLYVIVRRTINGATVRYIERMASRRFATHADAFFVDCGLTYTGAAATVIAGLGHLEGATVAILGDGAVQSPKVVVGGSITLDAAVTKAQIGLPITADIQLLPLAVEAQAFGQGRPKNINRVFMRVSQSLGMLAGPSLTKLKEYAARTAEAYGSPPDLQTRECEIVIDPSWQDTGQVYARQSDPNPLTIVSMVLEGELAG